MDMPRGVTENDSWKAGLSALEQPVWPLCHLALMLYVAGPYDKIEEIVQDLPSPIETSSLTYTYPGTILHEYIHILRHLEALKLQPENLPDFPDILDPDGEYVNPLEGALVWIHQQVLEKELEYINSMLCSPCRCTLCCTGPAKNAGQEYFEIPLTSKELSLFNLSVVDTDSSRRISPAKAEKNYIIDGLPFFRKPSAVYHWATGWSLILTRGESCPNLAHDGLCRVYPARPEVCRRPQIFPFVVQKQNGFDGHGAVNPVWMRRDTLLAVWDCPYVRELKDEICRFASLNGLEMVFRENKC